MVLTMSFEHNADVTDIILLYFKDQKLQENAMFLYLLSHVCLFISHH